MYTQHTHTVLGMCGKWSLMCLPESANFSFDISHSPQKPYLLSFLLIDFLLCFYLERPIFAKISKLKG